jgi:hypothetical protein
MKKVTFLLATLLIGGLMLTGCKKDPQPTPDPDPQPTTTKVVYKLANSSMSQTGSDCFKYTFSYQGADGQMVTVNDVTLPWTSPELTVTLPFTAKIEGQATFNEADLPDPVIFGQLYYLYANGDECQFGGELMAVERNAFMPYLAENPDILKFSYSKTINR